MYNVVHYGKKISENNIEYACTQAISGYAQVPMHFFPMDGDQWLTELIEKIKDKSLYDKLVQVLTKIFKDNVSEETKVLAEVAKYYPNIFAVNDILIYFENSKNISEGIIISLTQAISKQIFSGKFTYSKNFRNLLNSRSYRYEMTPVFIVFDHDWAITQLSDWFNENTSSIKYNILISNIFNNLTYGEILEFEKEIKSSDINIDYEVQKSFDLAFKRSKINQKKLQLDYKVRWLSI